MGADKIIKHGVKRHGASVVSIFLEKPLVKRVKRNRLVQPRVMAPETDMVTSMRSPSFKNVEKQKT
jgi:hypothetical protein